MNLDKIQDDFIKESKELVKNIKTKLIHSVEKRKLCRKLQGKLYYYFCLLITFITMIVCFFLYFKIENQQWSNLFGNAFAGCLTGFIIAILGNIKNREITFYDKTLKKYIKLLNKCNKLNSDISIFLSNMKPDNKDIFIIYTSILSFLMEINEIELSYEDLIDTNIKNIINKMKNDIDNKFLENNNNEEYIKTIKIISQNLSDIQIILYCKISLLNVNKEQLKNKIL